MDRKAKIYVAGHRGLVGSALVRNLIANGFTNLVTRTHAGRSGTEGGVCGGVEGCLDWLGDKLKLHVSAVVGCSQRGQDRFQWEAAVARGQAFVGCRGSPCAISQADEHQVVTKARQEGQ